MTLFIPLLAFLAGATVPSSSVQSPEPQAQHATATGQPDDPATTAIIDCVCRHIRLHHNTEKVVAQTTQICRLLLSLWALPPPPSPARAARQEDNESVSLASRQTRVRELLANCFRWFFAQMATERKYEDPSIQFFAAKTPRELFWGSDAYAMAGQPGSAHFSLR